MVSRSYTVGQDIQQPNPELKTAMAPKDDQPNSLEITGDAKPAVPVYSCIVNVHRNEDGTVTGRVANLAGIESSGAAERDVLGRISREFKAKMIELSEAEQNIPWIDPPTPPGENEQVRSIPVHL